MGLSVPIQQLGTTRLYDVNRDLAHCVPSLIKTAMDLFDEETEGPGPAILRQAAREGASPLDVAVTVRALANFLKLEDRQVTIEEDARRAGLFLAPEAALTAALAMFGYVCASAAWVGRRDAVMARDGEASRTADQQVARIERALERFVKARLAARG
jgi:hypothetical protein